MGRARHGARPERRRQDARAARALPGAAERLSLLPADLLGGAGAFEPCVDGAAALFHTASPFVTANITDAQAQLVRPAVEGTTHAVSAALASPSVRRIIVTSSIAATMGRFTDKDGCFNEDDWNGSSKPDASDGLDAYRYSKLVAEREFWRLLDEHAATPATLVTGATVLPRLSSGRRGRARRRRVAAQHAPAGGQRPPRGRPCATCATSRARTSPRSRRTAPTARARAAARAVHRLDRARGQARAPAQPPAEGAPTSTSPPPTRTSEPDALGPHLLRVRASRCRSTSVRDPDVSSWTWRARCSTRLGETGGARRRPRPGRGDSDGASAPRYSTKTGEIACHMAGQRALVTCASGQGRRPLRSTSSG